MSGGGQAQAEAVLALDARAPTPPSSEGVLSLRYTMAGVSKTAEKVNAIMQGPLRAASLAGWL